MNTEDKQQQEFFDLYSQYDFGALKPEEQAFVIDHFSKEEYQGLRKMQLMLALDTDDHLIPELDTEDFKARVLDFVIKDKTSNKNSFFMQSIPMYKVAIMLVFAVSLGLFADQIKGALIDPTILPEVVQLALLDSTINPAHEALNIECTDIAIMSENMTTIQSDQSKAISTVSTCEIKKILSDQPKKLNNKIINEFPVVSF